MHRTHGKFCGVSSSKQRDSGVQSTVRIMTPHSCHIGLVLHRTARQEVRADLMLLSRSTVAPVSGSCMRTYTVLLMRSCAAAPADVAALVAASWSENPELSCSRTTCVRSCTDIASSAYRAMTVSHFLWRRILRELKGDGIMCARKEFTAGKQTLPTIQQHPSLSKSVGDPRH